MGLEYRDLQEIIEALAANDKIFSNEAQFQFELALEIKNQISDAKIYFEHLVIIKDEKANDKRIKMYVDLIVKTDGKYYPIELKYKTEAKDIIYKSDNNTYLYTFNQGAEDYGSYDFIKDIHRLELLVMGDQAIWDYDLIIKNKDKYDKIVNPVFDCTSLGILSKDKGIKFEKGYAIMITNDDKYFNKDKDTKNNKNEEYYWKNYFLTDKAIIEGELYWTNKANGKPVKIDGEIINNYENYINYVKTDAVKNCAEERVKPINIKGSYTINWQPYEVKGYTELNIKRSKKHPFNYLIIEVKNQSNMK